MALCNLKLLGNGKLVQRRSIAAGEPLTFDYGVERWTHRVTSVPWKQWMTTGSISHRKGQADLFTSMHQSVLDYTALLSKEWDKRLGQAMSEVEREQVLRIQVGMCSRSPSQFVISCCFPVNYTVIRCLARSVHHSSNPSADQQYHITDRTSTAALSALFCQIHLDPSHGRHHAVQHIRLHNSHRSGSRENVGNMAHGFVCAHERKRTSDKPSCTIRQLHQAPNSVVATMIL